MQQTLAARGVNIGVEEAARLSAAFLGLLRDGLIEPGERKVLDGD